MRFLSYDSKFGRFFLKLSYACCLNFMWFVCCLPIFTIGASTTALYYTSFKIAKDEGSFITTMFFRSFRQNFKQATIIWMIMLAVGLAIGADAILLFQLHRTTTGAAAVVWTLLLAVIFACAIFYAIVLAHIFPLLSIASNTTANMFKNAFLIRLGALLRNEMSDEAVLERIEKLRAIVAPETARDLARWNLAANTFDLSVERLKTFTTGRAREMASAARGYFGLTQDQAAQYFGPLA